MALKIICSIPRNWTLEDFRRHSCSDGSHSHLSRAAVYQKELKGLVIWLVQGKTKREKGVVHILPDHPGPATRTPAGGPVNTGLSYRVGEQLAIGIYRSEDWALAMYAQIKNRREDSASLAPA